MDEYEKIYQYENLYMAHKRARKGKRDDSEVLDFELNLLTELYKLQWELKNGIYYPQKYQRFTIHDPKEREIHALHYRDRVVQHSLCDNVIAPYMERHLIYDNSASRVGKGTHFSMNRLTYFLQQHYKKYGTDGFFLKFDIRKYYDSIDHEILLELCKKAFPQKDVGNLLKIIIESYHGKEKKGLPLGNQTSQWFALYYLNGLDRLIKEQLKIKYYTRYMDDGIIVHEDKEYLKECLEIMECYINNKRKLEFNTKTQIVPLAQGVDYLGFHFYLSSTGKVIRRLRTSNKKRMKRRLKRFRIAYRDGKISQDAIHRSLISYCGHLSHGHTYHLKKNILNHLNLQKRR